MSSTSQPLLRPPLAVGARARGFRPRAVLPFCVNRNPLMPEGTVRRADPVAAVRTAGEHLARLVPVEARVFFFGQVDVFYFSGLPPTYVQQITNYDTLAVNDRDNQATLRSGYYGMPQVEQWLGRGRLRGHLTRGSGDLRRRLPQSPEINRPGWPYPGAAARHFVKVGPSGIPYYTYDATDGRAGRRSGRGSAAEPAQAAYPSRAEAAWGRIAASSDP